LLPFEVYARLRRVHAFGLQAVAVATRGGLGIGGRGMMILIEEVALEELLRGGVLKVHLVLFHGFFVFPLLIVNMILVKVL